MARPPRLNGRQLQFIENYLADPERRVGDAALKAGYKTDKEGFRLLQRPLVRAYIEAANQKKIDAVVATSTIDAQDHIRILEDQVAGLLLIKQERAVKYAAVPGGASGMIVSRVRYFGQGENVRSFTEHVVDNGTNKEIRETLKQIAIMRGEWVEKAENKNVGAGTGQIIITEIVVEPAAAAAELPEATDAEYQVVDDHTASIEAIGRVMMGRDVSE